MRLLILGGNGQLGRELTAELASLGEVLVSTRDGVLHDGGSSIKADLARPSDLLAALREANADVVVNAAAYTATDRAEDEAETARRINAEAPAEIARACASAGSLLIHFSTDYVFGGAPQAGPYRPWREDDPVHPVNTYGQTKFEGEVSIRDSGCKHLILRTSWLYSEHGSNFLQSMLRLGKDHKTLRIVDDRIGSPTWAHELSHYAAQMIESLAGDGSPAEVLAERAGTYHVAASGHTSWFGFAQAIFERAGALVPSPPELIPISSADYGARARRPAYSVLDCSRFSETFGIEIAPWEAALAECLDRIAGKTST